MRMVHWRRPLAFASPSRKFALTRATISRSQADLVLFLITKRVREPEDMRQQKRTLIIVLLHQFHVGISTSPCSTRCDIVYEDSFLKTFLLKDFLCQVLKAHQ